VLLDATGTLVSKGLVNSREHLESLLEAMGSGVATLQDYLQSLEPGLPHEEDTLKEQIQ